MQSVVGVQYKSGTKIYHFKSPEFPVSVGDRVIVDTANGLAYGTIAFGTREIEDEKLEAELKPVVRIMTDKDIARVERLEARADKDTPVIKEKIKELNLDMNVSSVEYSFDETKVTISFTSDGRVDFRELLKVLAYTLKCKIELRQIGVRDEVKAIGGMGLCGRECCCTKFLKDAERVTVKMAKLQNLSLSPTKTGGLCGRMMCCLAYEDPVYRELLKDMPELGKSIKTPDGEGTVTYLDVLKQTVTVKIFQNDSSYKIKEYTLDELNGKKPEEKPSPAEEDKTPKQASPEPTKVGENEPKSEDKPKRKHRFIKYNKKGERK